VGKDFLRYLASHQSPAQQDGLASPDTCGIDTRPGTTMKGSPYCAANLIAAMIASFAIGRREGCGRGDVDVDQ